MVASDTVVGLVGAAVLVVALVGVFVIESQAPHSDVAALVAKQHSANLTASVETGGPTGYAATAGGACAPVVPPTATANCPPNYRTVENLRLSGVPILSASSGYRYFVFLSVSGGNSTDAVGALTADGTGYKLEVDNDTKDGSDFDTLTITLESAANPASPGPIVIVQTKFAKGSDAAPVERPVTATTMLDLVGGEGEATATETDEGLQVDVTLTGATNYTGHTYRAWATKAEDGKTIYRFIGSLNGTGDERTASVGLAGAKADAVEEFLVVLAPASSRVPAAGATLKAGDVPPGVVVLEHAHPPATHDAF